MSLSQRFRRLEAAAGEPTVAERGARILEIFRNAAARGDPQRPMAPNASNTSLMPLGVRGVKYGLFVGPSA